MLTGVPDDIEFATKPQLAAAMLQRVRDLGIPARWLAGDEVYGGHELRRTARTLGFDYVLAVRADHRVDTAVGRLAVTELAARVPKRNWMRMRTGHGLKGDRHYDWAMLDMNRNDTPDGQEAGHSVVLVRRHRYTRELSFYRCHSAAPVALATLVEVVCCRWRVEEDFQLATRARTTIAAPPGHRLIPPSVREVLRLLRITALPSPRCDREHALHWSAWRRHHQHQAAEAHRRWNNITAAATA